MNSCIISFNLNCMMQLKQFYDRATKVRSRKKCYYFWWSTWLFIAATGLVTLLKLDSNRRLFGAYGLQIQMTSQDSRAPVLYAISSFVHSFKAISEFKLELQSGNAQFCSKSVIFFVPCELEIWLTTLKNNRIPLLCYFKLCVSFHSYRSTQTGVTVRKRQIRVKIDDFFCPVRPWNLTDDLEKQ